jgi:DNA-binding response OmpR family regulator
MPAQIVLVHEDTEFSDAVSGALRDAGYVVAVFPDPLVALDAMETAERVELLITHVQFPAGRSNGAALALMARR